MRLLKNLAIFSAIFFSFASFASVNEVTAITLNSDEVILPIHDIIKVNNSSIDLFDGRNINASEIKNFEINDSFGNPKTISKGLFQLMGIKRGGGDGSGGG